MAKNYSIVFTSLRGYPTNPRVYTLHIGGGSGNEVQLKGGASPFSTDENADEDMFAPIRTQSGYFRIVDDGKDVNGTTIDATAGDDWWRDLLPQTNTERPVTLTYQSGGQTVVAWQGYMQSQNFSGTIYGGVQEREFPVQCGLASLEGASIPTDVYELKNFAWVIATLLGLVENSSTIGGVERVKFESFSFQGGSSAKAWLLTRLDWQNFMHTVEGSTVPRYDAQQVLDDICKFWGWTCRTQGRQVIFTCMDDSSVNGSWITFTKAQMLSLTAGTSGTTSSTGTVSLSGDIFASMNNDETLVRGIKRAVVKVDVNAESAMLKFAPKDLQTAMGTPTEWVGSGEDLIGYFKSPIKYILNGITMYATCIHGTYDTNGFERRIIYPSKETEDGQSVDVMLIRQDYSQVGNVGNAIVQLYTKQPVAYGGGSLKIKGTLYNGAEQLSITDKGAGIRVRLGIGMSRASAQWFYLYTQDDNPLVPVSSGWNSTSSNEFLLSVTGGTINGIKLTQIYTLTTREWSYPAIPVAADLYGYLYLDILGSKEFSYPYEIANLEIDFTREQTTLPAYASQVRERTIKEELTTTKEYAAENTNTVEEKWNADCIFATDNGLDYGHGLIIGTNGGFVETVNYGSSAEHPEQHLASRVASFGRKARRALRMELRNNEGNVDSVAGNAKVSFGGATYFPLAIGSEWRDDVKRVLMIALD